MSSGDQCFSREWDRAQDKRQVRKEVGVMTDAGTRNAGDRGMKGGFSAD